MGLISPVKNGSFEARMQFAIFVFYLRINIKKQLQK